MIDNPQPEAEESDSEPKSLLGEAFATVGNLAKRISTIPGDLFEIREEQKKALLLSRTRPIFERWGTPEDDMESYIDTALSRGEKPREIIATLEHIAVHRETILHIGLPLPEAIEGVNIDPTIILVQLEQDVLRNPECLNHILLADNFDDLLEEATKDIAAAEHHATIHLDQDQQAILKEIAKLEKTMRTDDEQQQLKNIAILRSSRDRQQEIVSGLQLQSTRLRFAQIAGNIESLRIEGKDHEADTLLLETGRQNMYLSAQAPLLFAQYHAAVLRRYPNTDTKDPEALLHFARIDEDNRRATAALDASLDYLEDIEEQTDIIDQIEKKTTFVYTVHDLPEHIRTDQMHKYITVTVLSSGRTFDVGITNQSLQRLQSGMPRGADPFILSQDVTPIAWNEEEKITNRHDFTVLDGSSLGYYWEERLYAFHEGDALSERKDGEDVGIDHHLHDIETSNGTRTIERYVASTPKPLDSPAHFVDRVILFKGGEGNGIVNRNAPQERQRYNRNKPRFNRELYNLTIGSTHLEGIGATNEALETIRSRPPRGKTLICLHQLSSVELGAMYLAVDREKTIGGGSADVTRPGQVVLNYETLDMDDLAYASIEDGELVITNIETGNVIQRVSQETILRDKEERIGRRYQLYRSVSSDLRIEQFARGSIGLVSYEAPEQSEDINPGFSPISTLPARLAVPNAPEGEYLKNRSMYLYAEEDLETFTKPLLRMQAGTKSIDGITATEEVRAFFSPDRRVPEAFGTKSPVVLRQLQPIQLSQEHIESVSRSDLGNGIPMRMRHMSTGDYRFVRFVDDYDTLGIEDVGYAHIDGDTLTVEDASNTVLYTRSVSALETDRNNAQALVVESMAIQAPIQYVQSAVANMHTPLLELQAIASTGGKTKRSEAFVDLARGSARPALQTLTSPQTVVNLRNAKAVLIKAREAERGYAPGGEKEKELMKQIDAVQLMLDFVENRQNTQLIEHILSNEFDPYSFWQNFAEVAAKIAIAAAATAAIAAAFPVMPSVAAAGAGALISVGVSWTAADIAYAFRDLRGDEFNKGGSPLGKALRGDEKFDPATKQWIDVTIADDALPAYTKEFVVSWIMALAINGAAGKLAKGLSGPMGSFIAKLRSVPVQRIASLQPMMSSITQQLTRVQARMAVVQNVLGKNATAKFSKEYIEEVLQAGIVEPGLEEGIQKMQRGLEGSDKMSALLATTAKSLLQLRKRTGVTNAQVASLLAAQGIDVQMLNTGNLQVSLGTATATVDVGSSTPMISSIASLSSIDGGSSI